jgi:hypothetical protein
MKRGSGWRSSLVPAKTTMGGGEGAAARWVCDNPSKVRRAFARRQLMAASSLPLWGGFYSKRGAGKPREKLSVWDQLRLLVARSPQKLNQTGAWSPHPALGFSVHDSSSTMVALRGTSSSHRRLRERKQEGRIVTAVYPTHM